jgi:hypothetical protein
VVEKVFFFLGQQVLEQVGAEQLVGGAIGKIFAVPEIVLPISDLNSRTWETGKLGNWETGQLGREII